MIARTFNGRTSIRTWSPPLSLAVTVGLMAMFLVVGLRAGSEPATAFEGWDVTVGADTSEDSGQGAPLATIEPTPAEAPLVPDPIETTPAILAPPADSPASDPTPTLDLTPTEPTIA